MYSAPAGARPAGADRIDPADAILPNGRIAAPAGTSLLVGTGALGMALSPDGRYAILSGTTTLSVVNVETMTLASVYQKPPASFFMGIAATRDPRDPTQTLVLASDAAAGAVDVFDLDPSGTLVAQMALTLPSQHKGHALPAQVAVSPDGRTAYVADNLGNAVVEIDLSSRAVGQTIPAGYFPLYLAAARDRLLASGSGLSAYAALPQPAREPNFAAPAFDPSKSSALSVFEFSPGSTSVDPTTVPMDAAPNGAHVGGAAPGAVAISKDGRLAFVALSNVDRVAVVSLAGAPRVVRGLDLRLYPGAPYGAAPSAEVLSPDGKRLYVALAGLNAVAVLDARRTTRYRFGLIPTAWYPTAIALSANGRYLYVANAKSAAGQASLQRVDLKHASLVKATLAALRYNRTPGLAKFNPVIPPLRSNKRSDVIDHVVYIAVGTRGYDAMLGDLKDDSGKPHGNGDPALTLFPQSLTPNLHALARTYALADNFYAADADLDVAKQFATASGATLYQQLVDAAGAARAPMNDHGDDPEDYGRGGYLFNAFARAGLTYRDYGGLLRLSGYDGSLYHLDVPALAALGGNVDLDYAGYNPKVGDMARADEFVRDMQQFVTSDRVPSFSYVLIPTEGGRTGVSDADAALGEIVDFVSHTPHWSSTAIFVVPEGVESPDDHVNAMRSYALVVSPLARRGYVGEQNLSVASIVKTEEEIFGLPPLALNDLLASDMANFFTLAPAPQTYQAQ
ncbi:MAG: bifunctional YncE family protein/alkaline phosphatase family protein [Candidatus Cybelea sp.]